jgi:hypothetical protein
MTYDKVLSDFHKRALELYETPRIKKYILSLIRKVEKFSRYQDPGDYMQVAYEGIYLAVKKYDGHRKRKNGDISKDSETDPGITEILDSEEGSKMTEEIFVYWFLQKKIFGEAAKGEVVYEYFDQEGAYQGILTNTEYRKKKNSLLSKGYTFKATNLFIENSLTDKNGETREIEFPLNFE